jgi:hypothetical protein
MQQAKSLLPNQECLINQASLRTGDDCVMTQKDLIEAAEAERAHQRDELTEVMLSAYT